MSIYVCEVHFLDRMSETNISFFLLVYYFFDTFCFSLLRMKLKEMRKKEMKSNTREEKQKVQMIIFLSETEENNSGCEGVRGVENRRGGQKIELENGCGVNLASLIAGVT